MEQKQISCLSTNDSCLVVQNLEAQDDTGVQISYTIRDMSSHHRSRIPELLGRRIRGCCHGWVILSKHPHNIEWCLWNPVTSKFITLPHLIDKEGDSNSNDISGWCLSFPPGHPSSILLLTKTKKPSFVFCRLDRKRKRLRWIEMSYAKQVRSATGHDCFVCHLTSCNDKLYALVIKNHEGLLCQVLQVDIVVKDKEVVISLLPLVECPFPPSFFLTTQFSYFLKGSSTELFLLIVSSREVRISTISVVNLYKLNMTSMMWEETEDLSDAVFFVDLLDMVCQNSIASELGGYIHIRGSSGKVIYSYHVKDKTISPSSMPSLLQTSSVSMWEMSEFRLEGDHEEGRSKPEDMDGEMEVKDVESNITMSESRLLNVPFHVLEMIMELCVGVEYMKFRATCKHCHLAAPPIKWRNEGRLQNYSLVSPWLMVVDQVRSIITFTDPMLGDNYFTKTLPVLIYSDVIYCSMYGWLLFSSDFRHMVFFNPSTNDIRKLPYAPLQFESSCFSAPPTSPDCMVVGFCTSFEGEAWILFVARDTAWRRVNVMDFGETDPYHFGFPTFHDGDLYVLCNNDGKVDVFKEPEEEFSWETFVDEAPRSSCTSNAQYFLAKSDQHLLLVIVGEIGESVEVFRLNDSTQEWEKIDGLGRHMIYICDTTCLCMVAKISEMENKIYFPRLDSNKGKIVFYSLETCRYHTFDGKNVQGNRKDLTGTKLHHHPHAWIEPSWS